jgi:ADP-heptose:LPS heptosyltransferase
VWFGARLPAPDPFVVRLARSIAGRRLAAGDLRPFIAPPRPAEVDAIDSILNASPRPKRGWAVLAPSASKPLKCVDSELMNAIETELAERGFGTARLLDRRESREPSRNEFRWRAAARLDFRGDLLAIRALLSRADLYVGSDSGILHLATACDVPAVGLFGPTAPELGFAPLGRSLAVGVDLPCRPCHVHGPRTCWLGHRRCWRDLRPEAVLTAIDSLLAERAGAGRGRCEAGKRTERNGTQRSDAD